jgi:hypothetical protein
VHPALRLHPLDLQIGGFLAQLRLVRVERHLEVEGIDDVEYVALVNYWLSTTRTSVICPDISPICDIPKCQGPGRPLPTAGALFFLCLRRRPVTGSTQVVDTRTTPVASKLPIGAKAGLARPRQGRGAWTRSKG